VSEHPTRRLVDLGRGLPEPVKDALRPAVRRLRERRAARAVAAKGPRRTLDEIGIATGTDKSSLLHNYLPVYDRALSHLRDTPLQLIEIGVHKGASITMWAEYFPRAKLIGIDIDPKCKEYATDRISIRIGNQGDPAFLERLALSTRPMVVIDDGSHVWEHQIQTFRALFPVLRGGGYFIVEDIHTSFGEDYAATYGKGYHETAFDYVAGIARAVVAGTRADAPRDDFETYCRATIESVLFLGNSVIVRKRPDANLKLAVRSVKDVAEDAQLVDTGPPYERIPAELVDASPVVISTFQRLLDAGTVTTPPAASAELRDVLVFGAGPAVIGDDVVLSETLNCAQNLRRSSGLYRPLGDALWVTEHPLRDVERVPVVRGKRHVLLKQTWDANYGHWMIDAFPKIGLLEGLAPLEDCLFVLNEQRSPQMRQVVLDALALVGVGEEQALFTDVRPRRFERLTVLGTLSRHPLVKSPFAIRFLEQVAEKVPAAAGSGRLYLSRNALTRRRLVNEDEVLSVLEKHDYQVVETESLSLAEQIALFRGATHVVANMGAAMTNLAFAPAGVSVLALATETMKHDFFYDIVCHKNGRYRGLQGRVPEGPADIAADFTVNPEHLEDCLEWLHSEG